MLFSSSSSSSLLVSLEMAPFCQEYLLPVITTSCSIRYLLFLSFWVPPFFLSPCMGGWVGSFTLSGAKKSWVLNLNLFDFVCVCSPC